MVNENIYWLRGEPVTIVSRFSDSCTIKFSNAKTSLINPIILRQTPPPIDETAEFKEIIQSLRRFLYKVAAENLANQYRFEEIINRIDKLTDLILDLGGGVQDLNVNLVSSIPAGNNNIGDVDIASALPAGENNIGDVDIVSLPPAMVIISRRILVTFLITLLTINSKSIDILSF
ncbi:hypothetical protein LC593_24075 [Nostoc sp. CHAB 5844]|nr:hypothetical protein [Nostoc sp. CHAB 5844]